MDQIDSADGIARVLKSLMDAMRDNEDGQAQIRAVGEKYEKGLDRHYSTTSSPVRLPSLAICPTWSHILIVDW